MKVEYAYKVRLVGLTIAVLGLFLLVGFVEWCLADNYDCCLWATSPADSSTYYPNGVTDTYMFKDVFIDPNHNHQVDWPPTFDSRGYYKSAYYTVVHRVCANAGENYAWTGVMFGYVNAAAVDGEGGILPLYTSDDILSKKCPGVPGCEEIDNDGDGYNQCADCDDDNVSRSIGCLKDKQRGQPEKNPCEDAQGFQGR